MKALTALVAAALLAAYATIPAATSFMPVSEVRVGMVGVGRTVFAGAEREEFKAHILGVLHNVVAPHRDLILARLEGGPLANTGVLEGMSGSPVYIDGRLVGAVSYSLGVFPKEPLAGITPIAEMIDAVSSGAGRAGAARPRLDLPVTPERLATALREMYQRVRPFADRPQDVEAMGLPGLVAAEIAPRLRPIGTPIVIGGFSGAASSTLRDGFGLAGFVPHSGFVGQSDSAPQSPPLLQPGDAVGVSLARGDYELGATGTVTHVDGMRVYAFGHPFFNLGSTAFPMTRAHVYSLLPSLMTSSKIATLGEVLGVVEEDRATTIAGTMGRTPSLIPVAVRLESDRAASRTLSFELVHDEFFTPLLTFLTTASTLTAYERQIGSSTFTLKGTAQFARHTALTFEDIFAGPDALAATATAIAGPVTLLMSNAFEPVRLERINIVIQAAERPRVATLERVWIDEVRPRAGETISVKALVRLYGGEEQTFTVPVPLPANATDTVSVLVADAVQLAQWEQRELRRQDQTRNVEQVVQLLNSAPRRNHLYFRLIASSPGARVNGETLTSLPPSVLAVLEAERAGGRVAPLRSAVLGAWDVALDHAVTGMRTLTVKVEPPR